LKRWFNIGGRCSPNPKEDTMAITVLVRAKLKGDAKATQELHDEVTAATKEMAKAAGDLSHITYLNPQDPRAFIGSTSGKA
jgi:hypothetical protein